MSNALIAIEDQEESERKRIDLIKKTVCKGASDDELNLFLHACRHTGLDPLMRQIYSIKRGNDRTIQLGIDGFRLIAERTGCYSPGRQSTYQYNEKWDKILSCTAYVMKKTSDGTWHEVAATAYFDEYYVEKNTIWKEKPHCMIAKCAECLALRKAFPANLSGVYGDDEMGQAKLEPIQEVEAEIVVKEKKPPVEKAEPLKVWEKMSEDDIKALSTKVCLSFKKDKYVLNIEEVVRFFTEWQEKLPLIGKIEPMLLDANRKQNLLAGYMRALERWKDEDKKSQENRAA